MPKPRLPLLLKLSITLVVIAGIGATYMFVSMSYNEAQREIACFDALADVLAAGTAPDQVFQENYENLQLLVEQSLVIRSEMLEVANRLRGDKDSPLTSRDLLTLKSGSEYYLDLREDLYSIAQSYECAVDADLELLRAFDISRELRLKGLMLSLGAALTLYDNYLLGVSLFEHDERLRRVLNDPDMGFGLISNKLAEATLAANSIEVRQRARRALEFYETEKLFVADAHEDSDFAYLRQLIDSSPSYAYVRKIRVGEIATNKFIAFERLTGDTIAEAGENGLDVLSGLFGNTVGMYEARKGKLYGDEDAKRNLQSVLQPLDIILEKTPFRLTDKFIPGHFGHVAIWTGTKAELIDAGVWDDLIVQQYAGLLSSYSDPDSKDRNQVIEALRNGVQLNTLEHFMNVDDIAILRPIFDDDNKQALQQEALLLAFRQLGKKYDFNFDVNTTDKIVCSELAYVSYPSIDWPTEKTLGRHSISPDNVAQLAWNNVPLQLVMLYHDGELVEEERQLKLLRDLMIQ